MASTKIQVKGTGLALNEDGRWELELRPADDGADGFYVLFEEGDLAAAKKPLGKVTDARLVIGAEEEGVDVEQLKRDLGAAATRIAELELAAMKAKEQPAAPAAIGPDHPLAKLARGHLQVIKENAKAYADNAKASDSGKFLELYRTARAGLDELDKLVPPTKNGHGSRPPGPPDPPPPPPGQRVG